MVMDLQKSRMMDSLKSRMIDLLRIMLMRSVLVTFKEVFDDVWSTGERLLVEMFGGGF